MVKESRKCSDTIKERKEEGEKKKRKRTFYFLRFIFFLH